MTQASVLVGLLALFRHLSRRRRLQLVLVFGLILASAVSEVASISLVVPFLAILLAPEQAFANELLADLATALGATTPQAMLPPLVVSFLGAILAAGTARLLALYATARFATGSGTELATKLLSSTLYAPYIVHISRHSSEVVSAMTKKVDGVVNGIIMPAFQFGSGAIILLAIVVALLFIDPVVAVAAFSVLGGAYLAISVMARSRIRQASSHIRLDATAALKLLTEVTSGIRDVIMSRSQSRYLEMYRQIDHRLRRSGATIIFISQGARHLMEMFAIVLVVLASYSLASGPAGVASGIPVLGALALGGQRMLPALQQMFSSWSTITSMQGYLGDVLTLLGAASDRSAKIIDSPIAFDRLIELRNVSFHFEGGGRPILEEVNLTITKGMTIGLIGETGSGKSTLANILMGLLAPSMGQMLVDGVPITSSEVAGWQAHVAYVPQSIYLLDASFEENIAIGNAMAPLDRWLIRTAAADAQIASVVEGRSDGYATKLGENGIQLSGGQRQRVGIARALYKRGDLLILDEATSALDEATERAVMRAIDQSSPGVTKLIIAHRLTTLRNCDLVIELKLGRISKVGSFADVVGEST